MLCDKIQEIRRAEDIKIHLASRIACKIDPVD